MTRADTNLAEYARRLAAVGLADGCPVILPASAFDLPGGDLAFDCVSLMRPMVHPAPAAVTQHDSPRVARPTEAVWRPL